MGRGVRKEPSFLLCGLVVVLLSVVQLKKCFERRDQSGFFVSFVCPTSMDAQCVKLVPEPDQVKEEAYSL